MVGQEAFEACHYMRFSHVDVIAFRHPGRTVPHEASKCELVHAALRTASAEGVTPDVKLKRLQSSVADRFLVRMLNRGQMPGLAAARENVLRFLHQLPSSKQHFARTRR